jgi:hypothetical protein
MYEHFNDRARRVMVLAQEESRLLNHAFIGTEHILAGLIHEGTGIGGQALEAIGVTLEDVRDQIQMQIGNGTKSPTGSPPFTTRAKKVLELAAHEAKQLESDRIGSEHLLLGLLREGDGVAIQVLQNLGKTLPAIRQEVLKRIEATSDGSEALDSRGYEAGAYDENQGRPHLVRTALPILAVVAAIVGATVIARRRGYNFGGNVIVRCRRGHLFTTIWIPGASLKAIRLGWARFQRCPVGQHWSLVTPVKTDALSAADRKLAAKIRDVRIP